MRHIRQCQRPRGPQVAAACADYLSMDATSRDGGNRRAPASNGESEGLVMRPVTGRSAVEHAQRLLEQGVEGIERRADGRIWALGVDRRTTDRRTT
jgi:hypothetical protein